VGQTGPLAKAAAERILTLLVEYRERRADEVAAS